MIKIADIFIKKYAISKKRLVLCIALFIVGVMLCSAADRSNTGNTEEIRDNSGYTATEQRLCRILEKIHGVGKADVMVTYSNESSSYDSVWSADSDNLSDIQGVVVVASGADNDSVKSDIIYAVSALLDVELCNIKVYPQK